MDVDYDQTRLTSTNTEALRYVNGVLIIALEKDSEASILLTVTGHVSPCLFHPVRAAFSSVIHSKIKVYLSWNKDGIHMDEV